LHNDLLVNKEQTVAPIADAAPVLVEAVPTLGQLAPDDIKAEVQAAIAVAIEAGESSKSTVEEVASTPSVEGQVYPDSQVGAPTETQP
jgi:hypothetical protein